MEPQVKPFFQGNIMLLLCCGFYLAWWIIAFHPEKAVRGMSSGWLLIPAFIFGILAIWRIVTGINGIDMSDSAVKTWLITIAGVIAYISLLLFTRLVFKRPVTTELFLIVGWAALVAAQVNALYTANVLAKGAAVGFVIAAAVMAVASLACYIAYYNLDAVKGYIDGMAPLMMIAAMTLALLAAIR